MNIFQLSYQIAPINIGTFRLKINTKITPRKFDTLGISIFTNMI